MTENSEKPFKNNRKNQTWPIISRLVRDYLSVFYTSLALAVFFMIVAAAMTAAFATIIQPVIDDVLVAGQINKIWGLAFAIFAIFAIRGASTYGHTVVMNRIGQSIVANIQSDMFSHFMGLDLKFFHAHPSGQLISRVVNDVDVVRTAVTGALTGIGKSLLTLILLIGVMFYQDWKLALAAFFVFPFAAIFVIWIGRRLRKMSGRIQSSKAELSDRLAQIFQGVRLVKAYSMEEYERKETREAIDDVKRLNIKTVRIANLSTPVNETLVGIVVFGIVVYGGYAVAAGDTSAGQLMSFITAFSMAYEPLKKLARLNNSLQMGLGAADRVFDMLDHKAAIVNKDTARSIALQQPDIHFQNITFQYEKDEGKALDDVSITIPGGRVTALVGPSGGGKTTMMNLIPRFFDVDKGKITIGDEDVRDFQIDNLRSQIALVSQDVTIFDDSAAANIGYGRPDAGEDEIIAAAKAAEADEFIQALPQGYNTRLGEEGLKLSGGQRQRIAIARAILRDAPILLLDEATSALDNEAEAAIQKTLSALQKGRTTLVIAHRLSTVQSADQILVLEHGKIVERGQHQDLLSQEGVYARIYGAGLRGV